LIEQPADKFGYTCCNFFPHILDFSVTLFSSFYALAAVWSCWCCYDESIHVCKIKQKKYLNINETYFLETRHSGLWLAVIYGRPKQAETVLASAAAYLFAKW